MTKSQNAKLFLFILFLITLLNNSFTAYCETSSQSLLLADSLYSQKKYTQALEVYEKIYMRQHKASPAMLLKMAFVKEGLGEYDEALYFLNLHYLLSYDKKTLKKMEGLAEQHKLQGYNYDDAEFFLNLYQKYQFQIDIAVLSSALLLFSLLVFQRRRAGKMPTGATIAFISLLCMLFILNNLAREQNKAIISPDVAYLMDGPSPGANVVAVVTEGHRVNVVGHKDIWSEIVWEGKSTYVKTFSLKPVTLR